MGVEEGQVGGDHEVDKTHTIEDVRLLTCFHTQYITLVKRPLSRLASVLGDTKGSYHTTIGRLG